MPLRPQELARDRRDDQERDKTVTDIVRDAKVDDQRDRGVDVEEPSERHPTMILSKIPERDIYNECHREEECEEHGVDFSRIP